MIVRDPPTWGQPPSAVQPSKARRNRREESDNHDNHVGTGVSPVQAEQSSAGQRCDPTHRAFEGVTKLDGTARRWDKLCPSRVAAESNSPARQCRESESGTTESAFADGTSFVTASRALR